MRKLTMVSVISIFYMMAMPAMVQEQTLISGGVMATQDCRERI
jgi:uncharacterized membrane-anchored protein YitT (DUF2179 family)